MFKIHKEELDIGGKKIILETGKVARQADGAIMASCGETVVIATAVGAKKLMMAKITFLYRLTIKKNIMQLVKYQADISKEKQDSTEAETLISRLIDDLLDLYFHQVS